MSHLKGELIRITTKDGLELPGILFEPNRKIANALIHIHGWAGNFYDNKFIDFIAKEAVKNGFTFLTFNNRGVGFVTDLIRKGKSKFEYVRIGGSLERFEDCVIDIEAGISFLNDRGYQNIVLEGHSTGCQKITYYKFKTHDKRVKGLIELSPADDIAVVKKLLGDKYEKALKLAKKMVKEGKGDNPVPRWMSFYPLLSAKTYLNVSDPKSSSGRIFDYSGKLKEIKNIDCPVLVVFGSKDKYQINPQEKLRILKRNIKNCGTKLFQNANHWFVGFEDELSRLIGKWLKDNYAS